MEEKKEKITICPDCGERVTEQDEKDGNAELVNGKVRHKKCRRIVK